MCCPASGTPQSRKDRRQSLKTGGGFPYADRPEPIAPETARASTADKKHGLPFPQERPSDNFQSLPIILSFGKENQHVREICRTISVSCKSKRICRPRHQPRLTKRFQRVLSSNRIAKKRDLFQRRSLSRFPSSRHGRGFEQFQAKPIIRHLMQCPACRHPAAAPLPREQPHFIAGRTPRRCCVRQ